MTQTQAARKRSVKPFPMSLTEDLEIVRGEDNNAYIVIRTQGNPYAVAVGSGEANTIIRGEAQLAGTEVRTRQFADINDVVASFAHSLPERTSVWHRVAPLEGGGVEIDLGDSKQTRYRVRPGAVERVSQGSENLFIRSDLSTAFVEPSDIPDLERIKKYLNTEPSTRMLVIEWLIYTLGRPKVDGTKYVHLVVQGTQGSGKTVFSKNIVQALVDPSIAGLQMFPRDVKNLPVTLQGAHLTAFDNMRKLNVEQSDMLCAAATRGTIIARKLYTNAEKSVIQLHGPVLFNGIHEFVQESDLAQRCLMVRLQPIDEAQRRTDEALMRDLAEDMPHIFAGVLHRMSLNFAKLDEAKVTHPERMIEFSKSIAASELVDGVPPGTYQAVYSDMVAEGQLDTIMDNPLVLSVATLVDSLKGQPWTGSPTELLEALPVPFGTERSRVLPGTPIGLSKRLQTLASAFKTLGIECTWGRGRFNRTITLQGPPVKDGSLPLIGKSEF